ncbi:hypothetical protein IFM89_009039, partial [Coptis chinensis]
STPEILVEPKYWLLSISLLQKRYSNRPIVEFDKAAGEQMKIIEIRLAKLFVTNPATSTSTNEYLSTKAGDDNVSIIGALTAASDMYSCN